MAEVYLCASRGPEGFEKDVAVKRIRPHLAGDPGFVQMFISEAQVASRLNHANVVQIFDFNKHQDTYYLAMEYVHGQSLWSVRRRAKELMTPMLPVLVGHIGAEVARGLDHAHRLTDRGRPLGIVHRDVTPHNVLLSYDGAVKLTDFGIAKAGDHSTAPGVLKGKFAYMSPEQARGEPVDPRTDVFALGIVLWEMLTGGRLFEGEGDAAVLKAVQDRIISPPARLNPEVPPELDAVVMRALARDRDGRYATAGEMERALSQYLLHGVTSLESRDVGAYLRALFAGEWDRHEPEPSEVGSGVQDLSFVSIGGTVPSGADPKAPTYVLPEAAQAAPTVAGRRRAVTATAPRSARPKRWRRAGGILVLSLGALVTAWVGGRALYRRSAAPAAPSVSATLSPRPPPTAAVPAPAVLPPSPSSPPDPAVPPGTDPAAPPARARRPSATAQVPAKSSARERGVLRVKIKPWGTVYLNGRLLGEASPELKQELPPGQYRVAVKHLESWASEVSVRVRAGQETFREWSVPSGRAR